MQANRLYWTLLHTSIYRLYAITFGIIIIFLSMWLYCWYLPVNRSIARLSILQTNQELNINTNVNTDASVKIDDAESLTLIADYAQQAGIWMQRCKIHNQHAIAFEGRGTLPHILSFFESLQRSSHSFECVQMRINRDQKDTCIVRLELALT